MKVIAELIEGFIIVLVIGVVVLLGTATLIHSLEHPYDPDYRADLSAPSARLICDQDAGGHCWIRGAK